MVFMDLKTYELWAESNIDGFHNEQIELDEVIAPIIRELNLKGYKTKFCCSGHPYQSLNEAFTSSEEAAKGLVGLVKTEKQIKRIFRLERCISFLMITSIYLLMG